MSGFARPPHWTVAGWDNFSGLRHAFFGRRGGVSTGVFSSLNCSNAVGDDADAVHENRRHVEKTLGCERLIVPRQLHGDQFAEASRAQLDCFDADGLFLRENGCAVGVLTADCVPLLLVAPEVRMVAAVHAGWKGTALGIAQRAVERMCVESGLPPSALHAALGPAIGGCCYEVGMEVVTAIEAGAGCGLTQVTDRSEPKARIDLRAINAAILVRVGVPQGQISLVGPCTRCAEADCFSHRGALGATGRQVSAVGWV